MLRGKDTVAESGESLLCSGAELKEVKIRRRTLLNSGLSIGISSEGLGEERKKGTIRTFVMLFPSWLN